MDKKSRIGNDPFALPFIKDTREETSHKTSHKGSHKGSHKTSQMTGKITIPTRSSLKKMTFYFRRDQLEAFDELSKQTGQEKSKLARMAFDVFIEHTRGE